MIKGFKGTLSALLLCIPDLFENEYSMLNRIASMTNIPPDYDGTVSYEQPYRRQVADAVLNYVQEIILKRP